MNCRTRIFRPWFDNKGCDKNFTQKEKSKKNLEKIIRTSKNGNQNITFYSNLQQKKHNEIMKLKLK